jgi:hypothetical protein
MPPSLPRASRCSRVQLAFAGLEARADIQRQLEVLQAGPIINARGGGPQFEPVTVELTATLKEIEDRLAALGADDA